MRIDGDVVINWEAMLRELIDSMLRCVCALLDVKG